MPDGTGLALADGSRLELGSSADGWALMAILDDGYVVESFARIEGSIVLVESAGIRTLGKSAVPTIATRPPYLGHQLGEVLASEHDLLGRIVLAGDADPDPDVVADALPPIRRMAQYSFAGTSLTADKVTFEFGGRSTIFDPAVIEPSIAVARDGGRVLDGLVGGSLPVTRFVYPDEHGDGWWEYVAFAPLHAPHHYVQPIWHRVARVEGGTLVRATHVDSYPPAQPHGAPGDPAGFYRDLRDLDADADELFSGGMRIEIPDERLAAQARHSILKARATRVGDFPKYGVVDRLYGSTEHDGFQDTFNAETTALIEWGLFDYARRVIDNYLTHFTRDDGSIRYRGPQIGQYGRMLTTIADYAIRSGDLGVLDRHGPRITAICDLLLGLRDDALRRDDLDASYGMMSGWCEADSSLEADPARYRQPYLSHTAEAIRGFTTLARASEQARDVVGAARLKAAAEAMTGDLRAAVDRSIISTVDPVNLPVIAGAAEPFHVAVARDATDPQFRAYRANAEMLFSGVLDAETVGQIVAYREAHRDIVLGMPCAYGFTNGPAIGSNSSEVAGFLSYGHAYGLLQHRRIREFLLALFALSAHQYTRGSWTAPETRLIDPELPVISYAVPAQVVVPLLVRWMLVFEEPVAELLRLAPGIPRDWLTDGRRVRVDDAPTRWGRVSYSIESHLDRGEIELALDAPPGVQIEVALRLPGGCRVLSASGADVSADGEAVLIPPGSHGRYLIAVG